jgi:alpha-amylase
MQFITAGYILQPPLFVLKLQEFVMKVKLIKSLAITAALWLASLNTAQADVVLHAFDWPYSRVTAQATEIANLGYKAVLVVPPLKSGPDCAWYIRYQPQDYRVIDHCRGNTETFKEMVIALRAKNVKVYADLVLNHMANERNGAVDFPGTAALDDYRIRSAYFQRQRLFGNLANNFLGPFDFHEARCISDYNDVYQVQNWRLCGGAGDRGLPDLVGSSYVVQQQRAYVKALNDMGVEGYRVDAAKHMTNDHLREVFSAELIGSRRLYAEIITGGGAGNLDYDRFLAPFLRDMPSNFGAYDFPLINTLKRAFAFGGSMNQLVNPGSTGQALNPFRALTMPITHDIPNNSGFRYLLFDPTDEKLAYAYVLGRDGGEPMVFSDYTKGDNSRWFDAHKSADILAMIRFHNKMQGITQEVLAYNDCAIFWRRGQNGMAGINKCGSEVAFDVDTNQRFFWFRNYREQLTNTTLRIDSGRFTFRLPARSARMWTVE